MDILNLSSDEILNLILLALLFTTLIVGNLPDRKTNSTTLVIAQLEEGETDSDG